jgi:formylglycine-generating enzyme required for sulfatase activity
MSSNAEIATPSLIVTSIDLSLLRANTPNNAATITAAAMEVNVIADTLEGLLKANWALGSALAWRGSPPLPLPGTLLVAKQPFESEMILIPASEFLIGIDPQQDPGAYADEQPQHLLYLPDYYPA